VSPRDYASAWEFEEEEEPDEWSETILSGTWERRGLRQAAEGFFPIIAATLRKLSGGVMTKLKLIDGGGARTSAPDMNELLNRREDLTNELCRVQKELEDYYGAFLWSSESHRQQAASLRKTGHERLAKQHETIAKAIERRQALQGPETEPSARSLFSAPAGRPRGEEAASPSRVPSNNEGGNAHRMYGPSSRSAPD
jgi:hypothetical protein